MISLGSRNKKAISRAIGPMIGIMSLTAGIAHAQVSTFHFESICRSDPAVKKDTVTVTVHDEFHAPLPDVTINALWTYVDYRQNHAVFKYRQTSCNTNWEGICNFSGGSGRARWQLSEVVGYDMGSPAFDTEPTTLCPNTTMIDFW